MQEQLGLFSNFWWATIANDYSIMIFLVASLIIMVLKIMAILNPGTKTNSILCLVQGWIYGFPGVKKDQAGELIKEEEKK